MNPPPSERESPPITTRPGILPCLLFVNFALLVVLVFFWDALLTHFCHCGRWNFQIFFKNFHRSLSLSHTHFYFNYFHSLSISHPPSHTPTHIHTLYSLSFSFSHCLFSLSLSLTVYSLSLTNDVCLLLSLPLLLSLVYHFTSIFYLMSYPYPSFIIILHPCFLSLSDQLYFYFLSNVISLSVFSLTYILVSCLSQISCISIFYLMSCPNPSILCPPIAYLVSRFTLSSVSVYFNVSGTRTHDLSYERHKPYHTALLLSQSNLVMATSIF